MGRCCIERQRHAQWRHGPGQAGGRTCADTFLFASLNSAALGSTVDVVTEHSRAEGDKLAFSKAIFTGLGAIAGLTADAFQSVTSARDATDRVIYGAATGNLYYDADGTSRRAQVLVAMIGDTVYSALAFDDFLIRIHRRTFERDARGRTTLDDDTDDTANALAA
jgi:hypothetical protein